MNAAEFAGQYLVLNSDGFLMMALVNPGESTSGMQFTGTLAIPMRDAFQVQLPTGWRLIGGVNGLQVESLDADRCRIWHWRTGGEA